LGREANVTDLYSSLQRERERQKVGGWRGGEGGDHEFHDGHMVALGKRKKGRQKERKKFKKRKERKEKNSKRMSTKALNKLFTYTQSILTISIQC
jgi:hypothetical protein